MYQHVAHSQLMLGLVMVTETFSVMSLIMDFARCVFRWHCKDENKFNCQICKLNMQQSVILLHFFIFLVFGENTPKKKPVHYPARARVQSDWNGHCEGSTTPIWHDRAASTTHTHSVHVCGESASVSVAQVNDLQSYNNAQYNEQNMIKRDNMSKPAPY